jgi:hypothetical protein
MSPVPVRDQRPATSNGSDLFTPRKDSRRGVGTSVRGALFSPEPDESDVSKLDALLGSEAGESGDRSKQPTDKSREEDRHTKADNRSAGGSSSSSSSSSSSRSVGKATKTSSSSSSSSSSSGQSKQDIMVASFRRDSLSHGKRGMNAAQTYTRIVGKRKQNASIPTPSAVVADPTKGMSAFASMRDRFVSFIAGETDEVSEVVYDILVRSSPH